MIVPIPLQHQCCTSNFPEFPAHAGASMQLLLMCNLETDLAACCSFRVIIVCSNKCSPPVKDAADLW
jgi:hypothetical protein